MKTLMIGFVRLWRAIISPLYGDVCKYYPSCSAYGLEALQVHGAVKGAALTIWRILRCNPWSKGGYDPVPGTPAHAAWLRERALTTAEPDAASSGTGDPDAAASTTPSRGHRTAHVPAGAMASHEVN